MTIWGDRGVALFIYIARKIAGMQALQRNFFEFFSLPVGYAVELPALEQAFKQVQRNVHPDRFASAPAAEKRYAMQLATRANEAYQTLRQPLTRARYLCELNGVDIEAESNTAMPADFMMQQMQWRESLEDAVARKDPERFGALRAELQQALAQMDEQLGKVLDAEHNYTEAAALVRRWMFIDRFDKELTAQQRALGAHH